MSDPVQNWQDAAAALPARDPVAAWHALAGDRVDPLRQTMLDRQVAQGIIAPDQLFDPAYRGYVETAVDPYEAVARLNVANFFANRYSMPVEQTLTNYDSIVKSWYQNSRGPITDWEAIAGAYDAGMKSQELGNLYAQQRDQGDSAELAAKIQALEEAMPPPDKLSRWLPTEIAKAAVGSIPYSATGALAGLAGRGVAGALAALVLPEGALAIGAIATIGGTAASMAANQASMGGLEYRDMVRSGMNKDLAATASRWSGLLQAAVESDQVMGLLPGAAAKDSLAAATRKVIGEGLLKGSYRSPLIKFAVRQGTRALSEGMEEATQQVISESVREIARQASNTYHGTDMEAHSWAAVSDAIVQNFVQGAMAALPLGALGEPWHVASDIKDFRSYKATQASEAQAKSAAAEAAKPQQGVAPDETPPPAGATVPEAAYRDQTTGRVYSELRTLGGQLDEGSGGVVEARLKVGDPENKKTYLYVDHQLEMSPEGTRRVVVTNIDFNRPQSSDGIETVQPVQTDASNGVDESAGATALSSPDLPTSMRPLFKDAMTELAAQYPGTPIEWNAVTPEEIALKSELEAESPTGQLQWFFPDRPAQDQLTATEFRRQIMQAFRGDRNIGNEADALMALVDRIAARKGVGADAMLSKLFEGQAVRRTGHAALNKGGTADAAIDFRDNQGASSSNVIALSREDIGKFRAVIRLGKGADFAAFTHEFFHAVERLWFDQGEIALFEKAIGKPRANWTVDDIEYLANQWEHYLKTGQAPDEGIAEAFRKLAEAFKAFVREFITLQARYGERYALSPELKAAYDNILAMPESGLAQAGEYVPGETTTGQASTAQGPEAPAQGIDPADAPAGQGAQQDILFHSDKVTHLPADEARAILYREKPIPAGWYVHGRNSTNDFVNDSWPTQFTERLDVALAYGQTGAIWMARPLPDAVVLDFGSPYSEDMDRFIENIMPLIEDETPPSEIEKLARFLTSDSEDDPYDREKIVETIRSSFAPKDIVSSAEAYDESDWINLLGYYTGRGDRWPDFVITPDGAVLIPGSHKVEAVNLTEDAGIDSKTLFHTSTDTPEFKAWFGDSKVVDAEGKPLVVYHGSPEFKGTAFDRSYSTKGPSKLGFWFADDSNYSGLFGDTQIITYLSLKKPKVLTQAKWDSMRIAHGGDAEWFGNWRDELIAQGFDGVMVPAKMDTLGSMEIRTPGVFAAFYPTQIKSVNNRGTWASNDPRILYHDRADLASFAADFASPEEFRANIESWYSDAKDREATTDMSDEEKSNFYRALWEEGQAAQQYKQDAADGADPEGEFVDRMRESGGVEGFLAELWGASTARVQAGHEGIADAAEYAEVERLDAIAERIRKEAHPTIQAAMITVGRNGYRLSKSQRAAVLTLIEHGALDYRALEAEIRNDEKALPWLRDRIAEREQRFGVLPEPENARAEGLTIAGRARLERRFENEEIKKKIRSGDITPAEIERLIGDAEKDRKAAAAERDQAQAELLGLESKLNAAEVAALEAENALTDARVNLRKVEDRISRLANATTARSFALLGGRKANNAAMEAALAEQKTALGKLEVLEKAYKARMAVVRAQNKVKAVIDRREAVRKAVAKIRAAEAKKKAAIELRQEKERLAKSIMRERSLKYVNFDEWEGIQRIQDLVDPHFRRATIKWHGEIIELSKLREDPARLEEILADSAIAVDIAKRLAKKSLSEWAIAELEELDRQIEDLEGLGRAKLAAKKAQDAANVGMIGNRLAGTLQNDKNFEKAAPFESAELREQLKRKDRKNFAFLTFFDMDRVSTALDGGKPGGFHEFLVDRVRAAQDLEQIEKERREGAIVALINDRKIDLGDLKRKDIAVDIGIRQPNGSTIATLSKEDLMFAMLALRDLGGGKAKDWLGSRGAYIAGNFLDVEARIDHDELGVYRMGDEALRHLCGRVETALKKAMDEHLDPNEHALAEAMSADWGAEFDRFRGAMIEHYNQDVVRVQHYVPLRRQGADYNSLEGELLEEQKTMAGLTSSPNAGAAIERIKIGIRHQLPVRSDLLNLYFDSVKKQEHLIAFADYFKTANRVFNGRGNVAKDTLHKLRMTHGEGAVKYIQKYLAELANPSGFKPLSNGEKAFRFLSGNMAVAYLGLRLSSTLKQVVTSPLPFMAYSGPAYFAKSSMDAMAENIHFLARVEAMSPYLRRRQGSWFMDALRGAGDPKLLEGWKKAQSGMMKPLEYADRFTVAIGWNAVYMRARADGVEDEKARELADDVTHKSQPSVDPSDLAPLFKEGGEFAKLLTRFQMPMNRVFQQIFYDLPNAVRNQEYAKAIGIAIAYGLSGVALLAVTGPKGDDEEKKKRDWVFSAFSQFTDSVPFIGSLATDITRTALTGDRETRMSSTLLPAAEKIGGGATQALSGAWDQDADKLAKGMLATIEGLGIGAGVPTQFLKDVSRMPEAGPGALLGRKKEGK